MLVRQNFLVVFPEAPMRLPCTSPLHDDLRLCRNTLDADQAPLPQHLRRQLINDLHSRRVSLLDLVTLMLRHVRTRPDSTDPLSA